FPSRSFADSTACPPAASCMRPRQPCWGVEAGASAEYTYTDIVDAIRQHGADAQGDMTELWRRIAFFILINNVDDHLHNHGFLHVAGGHWRLSPAFDINPFPDRQRELKTWISAEAGPAASIDALMAT